MALSDPGAGIAIVGYGAIGSVLADCLLAHGAGERLRAVLARSTRAAARDRLPPTVRIADTLDDVLGPDVGLVVECCGHGGLDAMGPAVLDSGRDLMIVSTGVLARPGVIEDWTARARRSGARILVPAGAIAGLDGLGACRLAGLTRVVYTSTKPPQAWRGTPAEDVVDLGSLDRACVVFEGSARAAALAFPMNANLAATVALAGAGLDATVVRLVADPAATGNTGHVLADSAVGRVEVTVSGQASANPKTSAVTAYSLARAVLDRTACLVV